MRTLKLPLRREPLTTVLVYGEGQDRVLVLSVPDYGDVQRAEKIADEVAEACNAYPFILDALRVAILALSDVVTAKKMVDCIYHADKALAEIDDNGTIMSLLVPRSPAPANQGGNKPEKE